MKKILFVMFMAAGMLSYTSCSQTTENTREDNTEAVEDDLEEAGDEVEEGAEEVEREVEGNN